MFEHPQEITELLDSIFSQGSLPVYLVILGACFIENLFPPFPGDSFIIAAGALVAAQRLDFITTYLLVVGGGIASVMIMFQFGRTWGRDYFLTHDYKYFSTADIGRVEKKLEKWGAVLLISSRFIVGMRSVIAIGAGIGRYQPMRMFVYSLLSYFIFAGVLMYAAMVLVDNLGQVEQFIRAYNRVVWPVVICLILAYVVYRFRRLRASHR